MPCNEAGNVLQNRTTVLFYGIERPCFFFKPEPYQFGVFVYQCFVSLPYAFTTCNEETDSGFPFICAGSRGFSHYLWLGSAPYILTITGTHKALGFLSFLFALTNRFDYLINQVMHRHASYAHYPQHAPLL